MNTYNRNIKSMPKVDLHVHLDGSVMPETLIDLAKQQGYELPATEPHQLLPYMQVEGECGSLSQYLEKFSFVLPFMQTEYALERVAFELVQQSAEHGCRYIEVRYAPQLHVDKGLSVRETIDSVLRGLAAGESQFGVIARCIVICLRGHSQERNMEVIRAASGYYGQGIVAVDLAGSEAMFPPELYETEFRLAIELGLPITIHAGEAAGAESVETAVVKLGATRVGHGVRIHGNQAVTELILKRGIPLEMCPMSNMQTKACLDWKDYPLRAFFDAGIQVTVNTDNLTVSGTNMTMEYEALRQHLSFTDAELCSIARNGAAAAFLEQEKKSEFISKFSEELQSWLDETIS
ncbi:adenosine deaminase [Paenibacillus sp. strain BS8-2]